MLSIVFSYEVLIIIKTTSFPHDIYQSNKYFGILKRRMHIYVSNFWND